MLLRPDHLARAWHQGEIEAGRLGRLKLERRAAGMLEVPSGRIVGCDPLAGWDPVPFTTSIPPGRYPVHVTLANGRVSFLVLQVSRAPIASWEMLLCPGWDPSGLGEAEYLGYGVDAGMGCFADEQAWAAHERRGNDDEDYHDDLIGQMEQAGYTTIQAIPEAGSPLNVILCASGLGDGAYPSYAARDAAGNVVAFVTDFMVFNESPATAL